MMSVKHIPRDVKLDRSELKLCSVIRQSRELSHSSAIVDMKLILDCLSENGHLITFLESTVPDTHGACFRSNRHHRRVCILGCQEASDKIGDTWSVLSDARSCSPAYSVISIGHMSRVLLVLARDKSNASCWHDVKCIHVS